MAVKSILVIIFAFACSQTAAQNIKLVLFDVSREGNPRSLSKLFIVDSSGVADTEPSFHPVDSILYFIRVRNGTNEIVSYNYNDRSESVVATSPDKLLHPRITPDGKDVSCIRNNQLGKFSIASKQWSMVYADSPVVNYMWIDENSLLIISDSDPNSLSLVTLRPRRIVTVAEHVGQTLQRSGKSFAFVHKLSVDAWSIKRINPDGRIEIIGETLPDADLFALTSSGVFMMANAEGVFTNQSSSGWTKSYESEIPAGQVKSIGANASGDKIFILLATP